MENRRNMAEKLQAAAPYNMFHNTIPAVRSTFGERNSISFGDLLCPSLGELKSCLLISPKVDLEWLMKQYEDKNVSDATMTLLYYNYRPEEEPYFQKLSQNVKQHVHSTDNDASVNYHARIAVFLYKNNTLRVVIFTANLTQIQWENFNHGIWISPLCHLLPETSADSEGESPTHFKSSLLCFLKKYDLPDFLNSWIDVMKRTDFGDVRVFLLTSVPGCYPLEGRGSLSQQMEDLLRTYCHIPEGQESSWPVIVQTSCLGELGQSPENWLITSFLRSLSWHKRSRGLDTAPIPLQIIFPTWLQVKKGLFDQDIINRGLRYSRSLNNRQTWIKRYLYCWQAQSRSRVMPHCKTYCRVSPSKTKMAWFLLTTSNVATGSWGRLTHDGSRIFVRNFEFGILFLPEFYDQEYFNIDKNRDELLFPLLHDLPLVKYSEKDHPWTGGSFSRTLTSFNHTIFKF